MAAKDGFGGSFHFLARGDFAGLVLSALEERPMHGYEIMKALEERFHGLYKPSAGSIYPALKSLLAKGYVTVVGVERRKTYRITAKGRSHLKGLHSQVKTHFEAIQRSLGPERAAMFQELRKTGRLVGANVQDVTPEQAREIRSLMVEMRERILKILVQ